MASLTGKASRGHGYVTIKRQGGSTPGEPVEMLYASAALRRQQEGDLAGALELYLEAVAQGPGNALVLTMAADALRNAGRFREAIPLFDRALAIDAMMIAAWFGRALAYDSSGAADEAERDYHRVTELAPNSAPGYAGLASMQALHGRLDDARANAARAAALAPRDGSTIIAQARCDLLAGEIAAAADRLEALVARQDLPAQDHILALTLLGQARERSRDYAAAFDVFTRAKRVFAEAHAGPNAPPVARQLAESIATTVAALGSMKHAHWPAGRARVRRHIFLLGYPRSGTTLVEQVLGTIDGVSTLEEEPTLALAAALHLTPEGLRQLPTLSEVEVDRLRTDYWDRVEASGVELGETFVDMDPFKAPSLPLIARLFPDAKVVVMCRDPRDVVWSCFRQSFAYSQVTYEFGTLDRAARHYDATMRLIRQCLETFAIDAHELHYEALVRDFDATTQALCAFLGLPWSDKLRGFSDRARSSRVKTASAVQVRQPLYDGSGQWRHYADQLTPILPLLEPWLPPESFTATKVLT
ncbi:tetratricopeptide repeat-containing sulfotransferase family protein [Sphingomonas tabacisoli]|uniref:Tetratricopeptide repeat-containing sulfotransferase family protein n=1 Tax=Sphingomonas tabacisoli TaxID=2249466 RepID=A0ABW4HYS1_9SPHN